MTFYFLYGAIITLAVLIYLRRKQQTLREHAEQLQESKASGLAEPNSLHPVVDPLVCMGSGSCVESCPEEALGIVNGKAVLKNASACIGHGACVSACPVEAIKLVFGTEKRGVDIPQVSPAFETNIPGIFIAGELGGMGLIRKAAEQGRQAIDSIRLRERGAAEYDVVIVGVGPAGLSAGLSAIEHKLRSKLIEQEASLGGAIFHYPRNKIAMTAPVQLALVGKVPFNEVAKEDLLTFWNGVVEKTGLQVSFNERMNQIEKKDDGFIVKTSRGSYHTRSVLLAIGRRGSPRKLAVPGEETSKVVYRLIDPAQYQGQRVLVVGGGDSALEAAVALSEQAGTEVILSYRGEAFSRVKQKNRLRVEQQKLAGSLRVLLNSNVKTIEARAVSIEHDGKIHEFPNDAVIICAGGLLPIPLLQEIGIRFDTKYGTS
jgi:thioredoxin reductase/NAD-dependent dihydropyrimidine dehydrogenase PreA subunit